MILERLPGITSLLVLLFPVMAVSQNKLPTPNSCTCTVEGKSLLQSPPAKFPQEGPEALYACSAALQAVTGDEGVKKNNKAAPQQPTTAAKDNEPEFLLYGITSQIGHKLDVTWKDAAIGVFPKGNPVHLSLNASVTSIRSTCEGHIDGDSPVEYTEIRRHQGSFHVFLTRPKDQCLPQRAIYTCEAQKSPYKIFSTEPSQETSTTNVALELTLASGKSVVFSTSIASFANSIALPGEWLRYESSLEKLGLQANWSYNKMLLGAGAGAASGGIAAAAGAPKWTIALGGAVGFMTALGHQSIKRRGHLQRLTKWLGEAPHGLYTVITNNSQENTMPLKGDAADASIVTGRVLVFDSKSSVAIGTDIGLGLQRP